ncbi:MAG: hypothetical protein ND866_04845, partial [Pyrinomonadaceae bacterium]|nr:hypothetical protein [Pyrinomonadaceae bacterium]
KVIVKESPTGSILFEATARAQYASQYWRPNRMKKGHPRGGVRWQDFIVTQIDSGDLYIWY